MLVYDRSNKLPAYDSLPAYDRKQQYRIFSFDLKKKTYMINASGKIINDAKYLKLNVKRFFHKTNQLYHLNANNTWMNTPLMQTFKDQCSNIVLSLLQI